MNKSDADVQKKKSHQSLTKRKYIPDNDIFEEQLAKITLKVV